MRDGLAKVHLVQDQPQIPIDRRLRGREALQRDDRERCAETEKKQTAGMRQAQDRAVKPGERRRQHQQEGGELEQRQHTIGNAMIPFEVAQLSRGRRSRSSSSLAVLTRPVRSGDLRGSTETRAGGR